MGRVAGGRDHAGVYVLSLFSQDAPARRYEISHKVLLADQRVLIESLRLLP